ncbi:Radical SAM superfamily enzyme [Methanonatronarchaeum thermophilum]|uniref:Radical SAM superfamily enzyme n=1 Tax=Methanonatronarchaeum thermophilum TaxID=1927129 RepID=A0A1Y3GGY1_9EURY|nr:radical SAM protein [Methanonatronarchaeum thermophilum]OUJ19454.1 Radical SAM superfamily enzyme [Methanonatronarchaeum thermophilum]
MIVFSKLLSDNGTVYEAMRARYKRSKDIEDSLIRFSTDLRPVVMWNITRECNLDCKHCYLDAKEPHPNELTLKEGKQLIDELAEMEIPMLIFTGGEPLASDKFFDYANYAKQKGVRTVISTNGTLITEKKAQKLKEAGIRYAGVSLDGAKPKTHDNFRGIEGSFQKALNGIKNAKKTGIRTGIRLTLNQKNWNEVPELLDLALKHNVDRFCIYHLVPTGRGQKITNMDITLEQRKQVLDYLYEKAIELRNKEIEILTTDSPMDGVYILERMKQEGIDKERINEIKELLELSGGCSIGAKVANIDHLGNINPCHFAPHKKIGNIRNKKFSQIWNENPNKTLCNLRQKENKLQGKCGECDYKTLCGGCRQKAWHQKGNFYAEDPECLYNPETGELKKTITTKTKTKTKTK